ncbi:MAG TPA: hypothetical protein VF161_08470 [Steroidobacteraceae bacterium]
MPAATEERPAERRWIRFRTDLGILLWASFLAACLATMVFFAYFDPVLLGRDEAPPAWLQDRMTAYTVGFFFFWAIGAIASFLTAWLIDTRSSADQDAP